MRDFGRSAVIQMGLGAHYKKYDLFKLRKSSCRVSNRICVFRFKFSFDITRTLCLLHILSSGLPYVLKVDTA